MNNRVLNTLEYNKIINTLTNIAISPMGKELASTLTPSSNLDEINANLDETSDATNLIVKHGYPPLRGIKDIRGSLKRLGIGALLSNIDLLNIGEVLRATKNIKTYSNQCADTLLNTSIAQMFYSLELITPLYKEITRCIISEEEIADDASVKLNTIRKEIKNSNNKIRQQLHKIINSSTYNSMLQDPIITMRNDRFCVPVKQEYRNSFKGMMHDQSSTGSTLFIEPMSVVQLNNSLKELLNDEEKEIERILASLSALAAEYIDPLKSNISILSHLDFVFAKGELSCRLKCSRPLFNEDRIINLKKARHPLLDSKTVVPIDIYLGKDFQTLVVTGPNTGGKTVTLKTLGLLSLMGQAGLHIPAFDNSTLTVFDDIFADIGDEQSIEQSLSTFSSHMKNIIEILELATYNSLVLFDELGAGTDPTEGAALAMAILENLYSKGVLTVATTHYSELKVYALSTKGVENASCEFDVSTLSPTYKLLIGVPGKSNAFAISKRLGLTTSIIDEAKKLIAQNERKFEDLITELETNKKATIEEKEKAEQARLEAQKLQNQINDQKEKLNSMREKILKDTKMEAHKLLSEAKNSADTIIRNMNDLSKNGRTNLKELEKNRGNLRKSLSNIENDIYANTNSSLSNKKIKSIKVGDKVFVSTFEQNGVVLSTPNDKGELLVQLGILKTKIHVSKITSIEQNTVNLNKERIKIGSSKITMSKSASISTEIDVRGKSSQEAIEIVDKYLDDAYLAKVPIVTIIHGKGTGTLRSSIHSFLRNIKYVKSYRLGNFGEGETGVTIVEFK
jgi:DNA mismatch repair protein MutS2